MLWRGRGGRGTRGERKDGCLGRVGGGRMGVAVPAPLQFAVDDENQLSSFFFSPRPARVIARRLPASSHFAVARMNPKLFLAGSLMPPGPCK